MGPPEPDPVRSIWASTACTARALPTGCALLCGPQLGEERRSTFARNSRFRSAVLDLAAPLHDIRKDELDGEDVRKHRRFKILTRLTICTLTVLLLAALGLSAIAIVQTQRARRRTYEAQQWAERRLFTTSVMLEQQVEGTRGFSTMLKNFDRTGLTYGMNLWSQGMGGLHKLLLAFHAKDPQLFNQVFGGGDAPWRQGCSITRLRIEAV